MAACATIALHAVMDVLVRAPLPAQLALAEGLHDHPSLINNSVVDLALLVSKRRQVVLSDFHIFDGYDFLDPAAPSPLQVDGDIWVNGHRALSIFLRCDEEGP